VKHGRKFIKLRGDLYKKLLGLPRCSANSMAEMELVGESKGREGEGGVSNSKVLVTNCTYGHSRPFDALL
jgi:hypothetical protein